MKYFECNLPMQAPATVKNLKQRKMLSLLFISIHERMHKLEEALEIVQSRTNTEPEQFAEIAKTIFNKKTEIGLPLLDVFTAEQLAENIINLGCETVYAEKRLDWDNAIVLVDTAFVTVKEWEAIRTIGIGGSDAAVTLGLSPYRTLLELFYDKTGNSEKIESKVDTGKEFIFDYGHKLEDLVVSEFCRRTGAKRIPETRMFQKKNKPFINANIDAIVRMPDGELYVFEAKTTTFFNKEAWANGAVPVQYVPQCRQYMSTLDDPRIKGTYIGCIFGNTPADFRCSFIERDLSKEQDQLDQEEYFWTTHVMSGTAPELSGDAEKDKEILSNIAKNSAPTTSQKQADVDLSLLADTITEIQEITDKRLKLQHEVDNLKEIETQKKNKIAEVMGAASTGICESPDYKYKVTYKASTRETVDKDALKLLIAPLPADEQSKYIAKVEGTRSITIKAIRKVS